MGLISRVKERVGRKRLSQEIRDLIFQVVTDNSTWGAPRIHSELLMLCIRAKHLLLDEASPPGSRPCPALAVCTIAMTARPVSRCLFRFGVCFALEDGRTRAVSAEAPEAPKRQSVSSILFSSRSPQRCHLWNSNPKVIKPTSAVDSFRNMSLDLH